MKINREEHKQIILEFLTETFKNKKPALRAVGKSHVYQCFNANGNDTKMYHLISKMLSMSGDRKLPPLEDPEILKMVKELDSLAPNVFLGRNYVTVDKNWESAVKRLQAIYPKRDWNLFEIEKYKDYYVVYD